MKLILLILGLTLTLSACSAPPERNDITIVPGRSANDYRLVLPFQASPVRTYHGIYLGRVDFIEIGVRLEQKSKAHFNPETFFLGEGQILDNPRLSRLVRRESADNPFGLNPPTGSLFDVGTGQSVENAVVVADVVELNFYTGSPSQLKLEGVAFTIVLNQTLSGGQVISQARLYEYGASMGRKLDRYIRSFTGLEDLPIYIGLFSTNRSDATLPGSYIGDGFFTNRGGQFSPNNETWVLFPSAQASALDPQLADQFNALRSEITRFIPESVGVIGQARYVDDRIHELRITLTIQAKTYTEVHALVQHSAVQVANLVPNDFRIVVRVNSIDETLAVIERSAENELSIIYTY
jgi:protein involved in sex pheromone biosynthesis